ncbi:MAG: hypothetical protein Q9220_003628 [cf. Caloplaca sp. 1 TL-2023]
MSEPAGGAVRKRYGFLADKKPEERDTATAVRCIPRIFVGLRYASKREQWRDPSVWAAKFWIASIDPSQVVTTDIYTYIGVIVEVLNDGFPRAAWLIIGDKTNRSISSRLRLSYTLILIQTILGAIMTVIFVASSSRLAAAFVPAQVRDSSIRYVQISSIQALSSAIQVAVSNCTRALDNPDVPLLIASVSVAINILLDLLIISKFHVGSWTPTDIDQALIRMTCDITSALAGVVYFAYIARRLQRRRASVDPTAPDLKAFSVTAVKILAGPSAYTFVESAQRNALYLWLAAIASPAFVACLVAIVVEVPICVALSLRGMEQFAFYLSGSAKIASITAKMWQNIDWCYVFYALNYQLSAILLATNPRWYLYQALGSNLLWVLPWAIVVTKVKMSQEHAWNFYSIIFGGSLVFSFLVVGVVLLLWASRLMKGKITLQRVEKVAP